MSTETQAIDWSALTGWELTEAAKAFDVAKQQAEAATATFTAARHRLDLAKNAHELALEKIGAMLKEPEAKP